ncbi:hypothetical protein [Rhizobium terrae]|uniref:hypothetical protein n=1 Tax=Rhizobium terrae TaxID=2171756 RepID=UPI000E3E494E|nr:hypothetical protein [Rhizobium terrae]
MEKGWVLLALGLALASSSACAEEKPRWQLFDEGENATIVFGVPETDYAEVNLSCRKNMPDIAFVYVALDMPKAPEGLRTNVVLVNKGFEYRIPVVGSRSMMDDAFILEGTFRMEASVKRLFEQERRFTVKLKGERDRTYSFDGFRNEIRKFIETCR